MQEKIRILIGDNEDNWGTMCAKQFDPEYYEVIVTERDAFQILEAINLHNPHIIVVETFMNHITSIGFLELSKYYQNYSPKFIIINSDGNRKAKDIAMEHGASFYLVKPFGIDMLMDCVSQLSQRCISEKPTSSRKIEHVVTKLFFDMKIPANLKGYQYLRQAIIFSYQDRTLMDSVTKRLYPTVASEFSTNMLSVERAIRNAIDAAWKNADRDVLDQYFAGQIKKPSNSKFIATIIEYLRLEEHLSQKGM